MSDFVTVIEAADKRHEEYIKAFMENKPVDGYKVVSYKADFLEWYDDGSHKVVKTAFTLRHI